MANLRTLRLRNEWEFANALLDENPLALKDLRQEHDHFSLTLIATPSLIDGDEGITTRTTHRVRFEFPRYYPAVPIEAYLSEPVLHPNVHPTNGFVCLWDRSSSGDTIVEEVCQLTRILTWELANFSAEHLMQPGAAERFLNGELGTHLPLSCAEIMKPKAWHDLHKFRRPGYRPRLSQIASE